MQIKSRVYWRTDSMLPSGVVRTLQVKSATHSETIMVQVVDGTQNRWARRRCNAAPSQAARNRKLFMSSNVNDVRRAFSGEPMNPATTSDRENSSASLRLDARTIERLGASQFDKKQKRTYDAKRVQALGGRAPKNEALDIAAGNLVVKKTAVRQSTGGLKVGLGKFSRGQLTLSGRDIRAVENDGSSVRISQILSSKKRR
ncbi:unnamed protein product (mitochondrion) [Plasmodiophora brassicae]|uniref:Uncharacterized protein n=1 Tax=Plasmodiophora brassicae TaxID=37360 RepID=A0A3P3YBY9_PLABS|nr:unnamed protein product [Plasmodiophora brassicae]